MRDAFVGTNPYIYALSCISGKWKMSILNHIHHYGSIRFSKTKKTFPISEKVLSQQLKELVSDGLLKRTQYNEIPLRVEYHLTDVGKALMPAIDFIYVWAINKMRDENIEIDPDAFLVHDEEKYEIIVNEFLENYDRICDIVRFSKEHQLDFDSIIEILEEHCSSK